MSIAKITPSPATSASSLFKLAVGHTPSSNPIAEWWNGPKGTGTLATMDKWYNPWTKNTDGLSKGEGTLMNAGRVAMGVGAGAGLAAGGLAAAPALSSAGTSLASTAGRVAASPVGKGLSQAYKGYRIATTPVMSHAAKFAPKALQPTLSSAATSTGVGLTAATAYDTYDNAATATSDTAQQLARQAGVSDPKVLQTVGDRARGQMLPLAYKSLAPGWLGGDTSPMGQQIKKDIGTVAYHNISPAMLRPSQAAVNMTPMQRGITAAFGNPISAATSAFMKPRPSSAQMWNNVPQQQRQQITSNFVNTATSPNAMQSSLAQTMGHIFEPVAQHHQQNFQTASANLANSAQQFGMGMGGLWH